MGPSGVMAQEFTRPGFGSKGPSMGAKPKKKAWPARANLPRDKPAHLPVRAT
ncbi:hypothetical protein F2Q70_00030608 [Brassica cretica]|uniref:Uncharacterized protein n=2 Tax=Brassica cretica TaxID=69181 RepID=A0A8S9H4T7_BRACR|nr:hypothetical protein F2Q70_00030608 [Brassica cretica]KAF2554041.1 hypothetical protein F2Q68_00035050 [Brassica cretica]KAF3597181.1 hypothetical protein DY000_02023219 [Brassica cretica]